MTQSMVFIASSSEGLKIAKPVRSLLLQELRDNVVVTLWTRAFELSATYIESLERVVEKADFAVLVMTPDDVTTSRKKKESSPRDNVVFELGMFMGCLGRERCFIVKEDRPDLKLPTDLLGVHSAVFRHSPDHDIKVALDAPCLSISERITELGIKFKISKDVLVSQAAVRQFSHSVKGAWWEKITGGDPSAISFVWIETDDVPISICLRGKSYNKEGLHVANWRSVLSRIEKDGNKILYHWKGEHTRSDANVSFHGFGETAFDRPIKSGDAVTRGAGWFWNINEAHPESTTVKPIQLRRVEDESVISTMTIGSDKAIRSLVTKTLLEW